MCIRDRHRGNAIYGLILLNHKQQAHFELALRGNAVQAVDVYKRQEVTDWEGDDADEDEQ